MSNLLKDASILLTPTGYDDGSMNSIKPENGDGDFTFSRSSAATRVNAQGLVENVQIISSELVSNGNFSQIGTEEVSNGNFSQEGSELVTNGDFATDSDWNLENTWTIENGVANGNGANGSAEELTQTNTFTLGKTYKVEYDILNYVSGTIRFQFAGGATLSGTTRSADGTYTEYVVATANHTLLKFKAGSEFYGSIDNVSVKEVGQDWTLGTGWSIGEDKAVATNAPSGQKVRQLGRLTAGKTYKLVYEVTEITLGGFLPIVGAVAGTAVYSIGTYTEYITTINDDFYIRALSTTSGSITNISVKEVGQDWTFGTGWSVDQANSKVIGDAATGVLFTNVTITSSNKARIKANVDISGGGIQLRVGGVSLGYFYDNIDYVFTSNGNGLVELVGQSFTGSVTNISVKEITDDTDLPRINYEGFSYQDALGSELVVNGDFSNGLSAWTSEGGVWTSQNGYANGNGANGASEELTQSNVTTVGKFYKVVFKVSNYVSGSVIFLGGNIGYVTSNGTYTDYYTSNSTVSRFRGINFNGSITNVSVKEYLGQEVVPNSGCGSWLLEGQSTNLITQSELFSDSSWDKNQTIVEVANITMPNGVINGYKLFANTSNTSHWMEVVPYPTATASQNFTLSLFVKSAGSDFIQVASSTGFNSRYQNFNISTGTKASGDISDSSITDFGNGWYRISVTEITTGTSVRYLIEPILSDVGRNAQFAGNANEDGIYIWGAQLENQSYATSYIPTNGATSTRNQDIANNSGNATLINSTEGTLYAEIAALADDQTDRLISITNGTASERISLFYGSGVSNQIKGVVFSGGALSANLSFISSNITNLSKVAISYKLNDFALWVNGIKVATDTSGLTPSVLNTLSFDLGTSSTFLPFYGKNKALAVYKEALTDEELTCLTTI